METTIAYNEEEFQKRYAELSAYGVAIPSDPVALGYSGLGKLFSEVQEVRTRISKIRNESVIMRAKAKVQAETAKKKYEEALDVMIDTDEEIKALPSDRTKVARANKKLGAELNWVHETKVIFLLIDAYYDVAENTASNLKSAHEALVEQCNIYKRLNPPIQQGDPRRFIPTTPI